MIYNYIPNYTKVLINLSYRHTKAITNTHTILKLKHTPGCNFFILRAIRTFNSPKASSWKTLQEYVWVKRILILNLSLITKVLFFSDTHTLLFPYTHQYNILLDRSFKADHFGI